MTRLKIRVSSLLTALLLVFCLAGCDLFAEMGNGNLPKIDPPQVAVGEDGLAVWNEVPDAIYYIYVIGGGEEHPTDVRSVQLSDGETVRVKAVSGKDGYADSDYSEPVTYHKGAPVDPAHDHTDVNGDDLCDVCGESVLSELSFYAVNDLHGKFMDTTSQPGVDEFTTYLKDLYADPAREEILLSSGDMWQGTVESSTNKGALMTEWMNEAGFVSMTLGNHEYDWGAAVLTPNSELAEFPFLAINVTVNGVRPDYCDASTVVERGGVKIGIIGAIGDCLSSISGEFSGGLSFATGSALTSLVKSEATRLRGEGCDLIVYSIHDGGSGFSSSGVNPVTNSDMEWYDTALSDGYVDLVFEGHTHKRYILQDEYGVYHMQGGGENESISCAEVSFNLVTKDYTVSPKLISSSSYANGKLGDDPIVEELYQKHFPDSDPYKDVLGYNRSSKNSDTILSKIAELYYEKGMEQWGEAYAGKIVAAGGYLNARSPYRVDAGNVTYSQLFSVLPFDNHIVLGRLTGSNLKKFLNRQTSTSAPYTIYSAISTSAIKDNETYYIIVDTYTSYYRSNNITEEDRIGEDLYARDLLAAYIQQGGWAS